jgi:hypothetical protein
MEVREALGRLSDAEVLKLQRRANYQANRPDLTHKGYTGDDLLNDAIFLAADGKRGWKPKKVNLYGFLVGIIRSSASHLTKKVKRHLSLDELQETNIVEFPGTIPSADEVLACKDALKKVEALFNGDEPALLYLYARATGIPQSEMPSELKMTEREVERVRKQVLRRINDEFNGGIHYDS